MPPRRYTTDQWTAAFWQRVRIGLTCWIWTGADNGHGYGVFSIHARHSYAHRIAYELLVGTIANVRGCEHTALDELRHSGLRDVDRYLHPVAAPALERVRAVS